MADVSGLCFAGGGALVKWLSVTSFTLVWTHSVQKTRWEEDWQISPAGLQIVMARVQGHGAGMEPPSGAQLKDGMWHWVPTLPPLPQISLRRSEAVADWQICTQGQCQPLSHIVPEQADPVVLTTCF